MERKYNSTYWNRKSDETLRRMWNDKQSVGLIMQMTNYTYDAVYKRAKMLSLNPKRYSRPQLPAKI